MRIRAPNVVRVDPVPLCLALRMVIVTPSSMRPYIRLPASMYRGCQAAPFRLTCLVNRNGAMPMLCEDEANGHLRRHRGPPGRPDPRHIVAARGARRGAAPARGAAAPSGPGIGRRVDEGLDSRAAGAAARRVRPALGLRPRRLPVPV